MPVLLTDLQTDSLLALNGVPTVDPDVVITRVNCSVLGGLGSLQQRAVLQSWRGLKVSGEAGWLGRIVMS